MTDKLKMPLFSISFIFIGTILLFFGVYMHELAHKNSLHYFGIESESSFMHTGITKGDCTNECLLAQSNIDSTGYHFMVLAILVYVGLFIIILLCERRYM